MYFPSVLEVMSFGYCTADVFHPCYIVGVREDQLWLSLWMLLKPAGYLVPCSWTRPTDPRTFDVVIQEQNIPGESVKMIDALFDVCCNADRVTDQIEDKLLLSDFLVFKN